MAPKANSTSDLANDPNFKFILSVLKNTEAVKVQWSNVAVENGIAHAKNAYVPSRFLLSFEDP